MTGMTNGATTSAEIDEQIEKLKAEEADAIKTINDQHERIYKIKENIKLLQRSKLFCVGVKKEDQTGGVECQGSES